MMKLEKYHDFSTAEWAGGTTTELLIYPKDSIYKKRNFLFRLSTATVTEYKSVFTELPGIKRKLMLLGGSLKLTHDSNKDSNRSFDMAISSQHEYNSVYTDGNNIKIHVSGEKSSEWMNIGAVASFSGDDLTESEGLATDLNLMMSAGVTGDMSYITLLSGEKEYYTDYKVSNKNTKEYCTAVYVLEGTVSFICEDQKISVQKGQLGTLYLDDTEHLTGYQLKNDESEKVTFARIVVTW